MNSLWWNFALHWFYTRRMRDVLVASPAIMLLCLIVLVMTSSIFYSTTKRQSHYRVAALRAIESGQLVAADLFHRKLRSLGAGDDDVAFQLAVANEEAHGGPATWARLTELAPIDAEGHGPAHTWLANAIVLGKVTIPDGQSKQLATRHFLHAVNAQPERVEPKQDLALHYFRLQEWEQAAAVLETIVATQPDLRLVLAEVLAKSGRDSAARREATVFARAYRKLRQDGATFNPIHYVRWATAYEMLDQLEDAQTILEQGLERHPRDEVIRTGLARVYFQQAERVRREGPPMDIAQLEYLEKALSANPRDLAVLRRIVELSACRGDQSKQAERVLKTVIASGSTPALVHTLLGTMAASNGETDAAHVHLEQACRQNPTGATALNNLAWVIVQSDESDLERALQLVNQAVEIAPETPEFRETRGQVFIRLGRWTDAVADLEIALGELPGTESIHRALSAAYDALGDPILSRLHYHMATEGDTGDEHHYTQIK